MNEQRNFIVAIALSIAVLIGWQYFFGIPKMEAEQARLEATQQQSAGSSTPAGAPAPGAAVPGVETPGAQAPGAAPAGVEAPGAGGPSAIPVPSGEPSAPSAGQTAAAPPDAAVPVPPGASPDQVRTAAIAASRRVAIDTPELIGSVSLTGARIDDLKLKQYRTKVDPQSDLVTLLSPAGAPNPYYIEHGWTVAPGKAVSVPQAGTVWTVEDGERLTPTSPVVLTFDNGAGLVFRRKIEVDDHYLFTVTQSVENSGTETVVLFPYALVSRHGVPAGIANFYILHEGLIGVIGEDGLQEIDYSDVAGGEAITYTGTGGWVGITDKYWAAVVAPDQTSPYKARFTSFGQRPAFQADYLGGAITVAPGTSAEAVSRVFAGAKRVAAIDSYESQYGLLNFDLLIDWGWFYFITKPMFLLIDWLYGVVGNFGLAILAATILIKLVFFPLANKAYVSMSQMKKLQPELVKLRDRFKDDRPKQQQAMMEIYKREKINPLSGCLPIVVQIPVFFALYKVLFVTIEMRHQPFFGWIQDLSAPDPTSIFNLFGLIPWDPPTLLIIGAWPIIMGVTMFVQMRLNPTPPDPIQQQIFTWMPVFFTFLLAQFPAGLVIYWAWNNTLSVLQQYVIMRRMGVKVELWDNISGTFRRKKAGADKPAE